MKSEESDNNFYIFAITIKQTAMKNVLFFLILIFTIASCQQGQAPKTQTKILSHADSTRIKQNDSIKKRTDSIASAVEFEIKRKAVAEEAAKIEEEEKAWKKSKAGRIQIKHPEWSREDCERLADRQVWIGMDIWMVVYLRGKPNSANKSDYGDGVNWQWCWHDYNPSCFYDDNGDNLIDSYN